jgi:hypothetical protein
MLGEGRTTEGCCGKDGRLPAGKRSFDKLRMTEKSGRSSNVMEEAKYSSSS